MPVIAETKVIPQYLQRTYDQLVQFFDTHHVTCEPSTDVSEGPVSV
jgi:hypothetical protein